MAKVNFIGRPTIILTRSHFDSELIARRLDGLFFHFYNGKRQVDRAVTSMSLYGMKQIFVCKADALGSLFSMLRFLSIDYRRYDILFDKEYIENTRTIMVADTVALLKSHIGRVRGFTSADNIYYDTEIAVAFDVRPSDVYTTEEKRLKEKMVQTMYKTVYRPRMQDYIRLRKSVCYRKGAPNPTCYRVDIRRAEGSW